MSWPLNSNEENYSYIRDKGNSSSKETTSPCLNTNWNEFNIHYYDPLMSFLLQKEKLSPNGCSRRIWALAFLDLRTWHSRRNVKVCCQSETFQWGCQRQLLLHNICYLHWQVSQRCHRQWGSLHLERLQYEENYKKWGSRLWSFYYFHLKVKMTFLCFQLSLRINIEF